MTRVEDVIPVSVANLGSADRPCERHSGDSQGSGCADHGRNLRVDVRVERHNSGNNLYFVREALREQRPNRAIDEAADENFLLTGPSFAFEKPTRDLARSIGFLLVVDRKREKVPARIGNLSTDRCDQNLCFGHIDQNGTIGLARYSACLEGDDMFPILERFLY